MPGGETIETVGGFGWTECRVEELKTLWAEGLSASGIARKMGNVTRNAVISKMHRLGLAARRESASDRPARQNPTPGLAKPPKPRDVKGRAFEQLGVSTAADAIAALERDCPATDDPLSASGCRWPIGDPASINAPLARRSLGEGGFRFCQRPCCKDALGRPSMWCEAHHAIGRDVKTMRTTKVDHKPPQPNFAAGHAAGQRRFA
jgi:GcrA cell cycle regulator